MDWLYFASPRGTTLANTLETVMNGQLIVRTARNQTGQLIANVGALQVGQTIGLVWRGDRHVYLKCIIGPPENPVEGTVIDRIPVGKAGIVGYAANAGDCVEGIRLVDVEECYLALRDGGYGGHNALHQPRLEDVDSLPMAGPIPAERLRREPERRAAAPAPNRRIAAPLPERVVAPPAAAVEGFRWDGSAPVRCFDAYIMVDWSSSSKPVTGNDSIWIASGCWSEHGFEAGAPENVRTRMAAVERIKSLAQAWRRDGLRVLVGLDFAFGYPAGFARALGLPQAHPWRSVHEHFSEQVTDTPENQHNRDAFAAACNQRIAPSGPGPFWACTPNAAGPNLTVRRLGLFDYPYAGLEEWRVTEQRARDVTVTQPVWKLNCGVSVGGQTIVGIKHLHEMAEELEARRWPFDTGWNAPSKSEGCVWFAEIFPSLVRYLEWTEEYGRRRDRTQVLSCVRHAAEQDAAGTLADRFSCPSGLSEEEELRSRSEEGWILFV
ncbi:MAG: hypothetical protein RL199_1594 [Pseudomonadota bacterium]|jgi:hypothetical protein